MDVLFRQVFACCFRSKLHIQTEPDENTPFIPPNDEAPPLRSYTVDHQKMKARLGTIVRAKEGKMVNVNQALPFNLHNKPGLDRSLSTHTTPPRATSSGRVPSYSPARDDSPSLQTSRSASSLQPGDASYLPPESDPDGGVRKPILNVRLIRGPGGFSAGGGRIRGRPPRLQGALKGKGMAGGNGDATRMSASEDDEGASESQSDAGGHGHAPPPEVSISGASPPPPAGPARPKAPDFTIEDVGDIAQSWGD